MPVTHPIIAIDGYSSCGKSTLAKAIANTLGFLYIDSGAMYRAVTLSVLRQKIPVTDHQKVEDLLPHINIHFEYQEGNARTFLNGEDVEEDIRSMAVSDSVSPVATIPAVRRRLVHQQRQMARQQGVAMDGRDIGTVVFPHAPIKLFITADMDIRVKRRQEQLAASGKKISSNDIRRNLLVRDYIDATRSDSPLCKATDAVVLDNTNLTPDEQLALALALFHTRLS